MVLHGLKRIFQKPTPDLSSSERTNQLRSKTIYSGTVNLSTALKTPGSNRYKTYNGPFEIVNDNGNGSLVASTSYKDLLDITKGKVLLNQLPLTSLTTSYYEKNFGNGEMYVGNYQQFDGSFFSGGATGPGPTDCEDSVLVYDISTPGFTGPGISSYAENSIGHTGTEATGMDDSNQDIFIDPKHCYYSDPCASSASYMKFVDIDLKGADVPSQYYSQQIINGNQYSGFSFPMSNFSLTCVQQNPLQTEGPLFCPLQPPSLSKFYVPPKVYNSNDFQITPPRSNSLGSFTYSSSNTSVATISGPKFDMITILGSGTSTITAFQAASDGYSSGSISTLFHVTPATFSANWEYTTDGGATFSLLQSTFTTPYDNLTYTIRLAATNPANATYTQLGTASVTNVRDGTAQLTITGSGNFVGYLTSPSITIIPATFSASWHYTNDGGATFTDITSSKHVPYDNSPYTISVKETFPANATYKQSGTASVTHVTQVISVHDTGDVGTRKTFSYYVSLLKTSKLVDVAIDGTAQLTLTGYGNFAGSSLLTPSITVNPISPTFTGSFYIPNQKYSPNSYSFQITPPKSNSGGAFSYASDNPLITFDGNNVTINADAGVGAYTITAFQAAAGNFTSRTVTTSFNVVAISPTFTGSFYIPNQKYSPNSYSFQITPPKSNSGGAFSYASDNPLITFDDINAVIFNGINVVTFDGINVIINADVGVGTYTITAFQEADGNFTSRSVTASFDVVAISPTFTGSFYIPNQNYSLVPFSFPITLPKSNSGGAFYSYSVLPNNHSVTFDGNSVTIDAHVGVGAYTITVFQKEDGNFTSGSVKASFDVLPAIKS